MATSKKKKKPSPKAKRLAKSRAKAKVPQRASNKTKPVSRNDGQLTEKIEPTHSTPPPDLETLDAVGTDGSANDDDGVDLPTTRPRAMCDRDFADSDASDDATDEAPVLALAGDLLGELGNVQDTGALLRHAIEAMLFVSEKPITLKELSKGLQLDKKRTLELLGELRSDYENRGIRIDEVADGYAFRTHPSVAEYVRNFMEQRPVKLSRAQLETLSIVAYRQPITRPEVNDIRGVNCGPVLKGLLERDLVRILGKKDEPGRPMLYGTTPSFLELFGLKSLQQLPTLREFAELNEDSKRKYEAEIGEGPPVSLTDLGLDADAAEPITANVTSSPSEEKDEQDPGSDSSGAARMGSANREEDGDGEDEDKEDEDEEDEEDDEDEEEELDEDEDADEQEDEVDEDDEDEDEEDDEDDEDEDEEDEEDEED